MCRKLKTSCVLPILCRCNSFSTNPIECICCCSCNFLNTQGYTCDMAEELGCDCTGCNCYQPEEQCDAQVHNVTVGGDLYSCNELCAPSGNAISVPPSVGSYSTLQLVRLGINCLQCECYDTTSTSSTTTTTTTTTSTSTTSTSTTSTSTSTSTTTTTTSNSSFIVGCEFDIPGYDFSCVYINQFFQDCDEIFDITGYDCSVCGCYEDTTTTTTTTTSTTTTSTTTTTTSTTSTTTSTATTTTSLCAPCLVSLGDDGDVYTCEDLSAGAFQGLGSRFGEYLGGENNGLSDGSAWTCPYLEEEYGCDCTNCNCVDPPSTTTELCPATCSSPDGSTLSCDATIEITDYATNCSTLEEMHGCDCLGCACAEGYCASKEFSIDVVVNSSTVPATCDLLEELYLCEDLYDGVYDANGFNYSTDCIDRGCGCTECKPTCLGGHTCDDWLATNGVLGELSCEILEQDPVGCDCSGCSCRAPNAPCSAKCEVGSGDLNGLQDFADEHGIVSCDDWGAFFTDDTFTCAYLEHEWDCDCTGCTCDHNPQCQTEVECKVCDTDVFSGNCDEIYEQSDYQLTCEISENSFGCDCNGCQCAPPNITDGCPNSCLGYSCDDILPVFGGDMTCDSLEGLGFDCYGCSACEYYDICDSYRYAFSNGFIDNQPKEQAAQCDGTPIRTAGAFQFCDCANLCELTDGCTHFDNVGLDCRLFAEAECSAPVSAGEMTGIWEKP